jgi:pimeloyl-ACP methyl ester carboxylesterase
MSGMISQYIAKVGGDRIKSVVLISPVPASGFRANEETMKKLMAIVDDDQAARDAILARGGTRYGRGWLDRKLMMTRRASSRDAMIGYLKMFTGSDVANEVRGTTTPVTVVCGEYDIPLYREESLRKLLEPLFPNLTVEVSREAGHYAMLETPPLLAGDIEKGIARGV